MPGLQPADGKDYQRVFRSEMMSEHSGSGVKTGCDWADKAGTPVRRGSDV